MTQYDSLRFTLDGAGEPYHVLPLQGDAALWVTRRGGRILGLFPTPDSDNLLWTNQQALNSPDTFRAFASSNSWNLGGERIWIGPEIQYNIRDRRNFWGTHNLPHAIDPGHYSLNGASDKVVLEQDLELQAFNIGSGMKKLHIRREIEPIDDPLRLMALRPPDVRYFGYSHTCVLSEQNDTPIVSEAWNLVQLNPGGTLYILTTGQIDTANYFGTAPVEARQNAEGAIKLRITGRQKYKIGYKAPCILGRMAYHHQLSTGEQYMLIRQFDSNPSATFSEEPPDLPGVNGFSVHVYNDDGRLGGFGEMECNGQAIGGTAGRTRSTDTFRMWVYIGPGKSLQMISNMLLGCAL